MVIIKLMGGLGNQMFQYATGRRLSHALGVELKLDISWFATQDLRTYFLRVFNIQENIASPEEVATLKAPNPGIAERVIRRVLHKQPKQASTYIREKKKFHFDPDILNLSDGVYLDGSWQSEQYFADIQSVIYREFTVKTPQTGKNKELAGRAASCKSVSLHIRRGDYISNAHTNQVHGICDLDYYRRSVEHFTQILRDPHFFIFSDEPKKARNFIKLLYPTTFVDHNGGDKSYEDLRLMSQCKHHIIANSTFSWWGAWLNSNKNKIVIAPEKWLNNSECVTKDLLPSEWLKL